MESHFLRIGELSNRVGVSPEVLRAWERRYGLLSPERSPGGLRLYSSEDEFRLRRMQSYLGEGLSAAEAAKRVLDQDGLPDWSRTELEEAAADLDRALDTLDDAKAQSVLDRLFASFRLETVLAEFILPYLRDLGDRWASGDASIGQEHFASNVVRGRLLGLARGWDRGQGPRVVLACLPSELHELALISLGLVLRGHGWRVTYLGPDTPLKTVLATCRTVDPDAVVLAVTNEERARAAAEDLTALASTRRVFVAGPGASADVVSPTGALVLAGDPVVAAEALNSQVRPSTISLAS